MTASRWIPESGAAPRPTTSVSEYMMSIHENAEAACDGGVARLATTAVTAKVYEEYNVRSGRKLGKTKKGRD